MVLYDVKGNVAWVSNTAGNTGGYILKVQDDNNLVFYSGGKAKWASDTVNACDGRKLRNIFQ